VKLPEVAAKVPEVAPAGMATLAGVVSDAELSLTVTAAPPEGAALFSVIVQVVAPFGPRLAGAHCRVETTTGDASEIVVLCEKPFRDAVMVAVWPVEEPLVMVKAADVPPGGIVTVAGTVSAGELLESATTAPPAGAGL